MKTLIRNILFTLVILGCYTSSAQSTCFTASDTVGCTPYTVTITNCGDLSKPDAYDYGDGSGLTFDTVHTYNDAGTYTVTQYVGIGAAIDTLIKTDYIRVVNTPSPQFEVTTCIGRQANIEITDTVYDAYAIDYGDGSPNDTVLQGTITPKVYGDTLSKTITITGFYNFATCTNTNSITATLYNVLQKPDFNTLTITNQGVSEDVTLNVSGKSYFSYQREVNENNSGFLILDTVNFTGTDSSFVISNQNTLASQLCYRIAAMDACNNQLYSDEICNETISAIANNNQNVVSWTLHNLGIMQYELYRDNGLISTIPSDTFYIDTNVNCGTNYCYRIETILNNTVSNGDNLKSVSSEVCIAAISTDTPPALTEFNTSIESGAVRLFWDQPTVGVDYYEIYRSDNQISYNSLGQFNLSDTNYIDNSINPSFDNYCYRIDYSDLCGNQSDLTGTPTSCPMVLTMNSTSDGNELSWTNYTGFSSGLQEYIIEWVNESGSVIYSQSNGSDTSFTDMNADTSSGTTIYRIRAVANAPSTIVSYSNEIYLGDDLKLFFPNAFTPNDDGTNDEFKPVGQSLMSYKLTVYSRWGEPLFVSEDMDIGWDGKSAQGNLLPEDVYVFKAEIIDFKGNESTIKGMVNLLH